MKRIERWIERLSTIFNGVAGAAVVAMMLLTCLDVLLRMVRHPIPGCYEIVGLLGALFVSFSLARTTLDRGHIAVDFLLQRLPRRIQFAVEALNAAVCAVLFAVVSRQCVLYALELRASGEVSMTLQMPIHPFVLGIAIGCGLLAIVLAANCASSVLKVLRPVSSTAALNP